jgi:nicotinate-nucleotide pyrophosphorylase
MQIASGIKTELWNTIIADLQQAGWKITSKYNGFDAGIDYDALTLEKNDLRIEFMWDNWSEGEIICSEDLISFLKNSYSLIFKAC